MEALHKTLDEFIKKKRLNTDLQVSINRYVQDPIFKQWWQQNPEWTQDTLLPFLSSVKAFVTEQANCRGCNGLENCNNLMKGHAAVLETPGNRIEVAYQPCRFYTQQKANQRRKELIKSHHIPKEIMEGSLRAFDNEGRIDAFNAVMDFCLNAKPGEVPVGIYLYGPLGVGKSYLLGAACNKLAERGIASYMVYTPDFFREMKGAIAEHKVDDKLQLLKEIPVLIFDDIGAETMSAWARDEILGSILQYRVMEKLPTLYTSNYDYDQLEEHLAYSQKGGIEQLKAKRIMERIKHYTDAYFVNGSNRRSR